MRSAFAPRRYVSHDRFLIGTGKVQNILGIKKARDAQLSLGDGECKRDVLGGVVGLQGIEGNEGGVQVMNERAQGQTIPP